MAFEVPAGWALDTRTLRGAGIDALLLPAGAVWRGEVTPVFAYVMPTYKGSPTVSVRGLIDLRRRQLAGADPDAKVQIEREPAPQQATGGRTTVVRYSSSKIPRYERVAYLEDDRTIFAVILSADSLELLERWAPLVDAVAASSLRMIAANR